MPKKVLSIKCKLNKYLLNSTFVHLATQIFQSCSYYFCESNQLQSYNTDDEKLQATLVSLTYKSIAVICWSKLLGKQAVL